MFRIVSDEDDIIEMLAENNDARTDDDDRGKCNSFVSLNLLILLYYTAVCAMSSSRHASTCHLSLEHPQTMARSYITSVHSSAIGQTGTRRRCSLSHTAQVCLVKVNPKVAGVHIYQYFAIAMLYCHKL